MNFMKKNIKKVLTILMFITIFSGTFGLSFYTFYKKNLKNYLDQNYSFKIFRTDILKSEIEKYNTLKENNLVKDLFYYNEYRSSVSFENGSWFDLIGTIPGNIKITQGRDLDITKNYEIICPINFSDNTYDIINGKNVDIKAKLNKEVTLETADNQQAIFKVVGLFDPKNGFYEPNECYTTHATIQKITLNNENEEEYINLYIQVNKINDIFEINKEYPQLNFKQISTPNEDVNNIVCGTILLIFSINLYFSLAIIKKISQDIVLNIQTSSSKEIAIECCKSEYKPVLFGILSGFIAAILSGKYLISKIIPSIYIFYNTTIDIDAFSVITIIIIVLLLVLITNVVAIKHISKKKEFVSYE